MITNTSIDSSSIQFSIASEPLEVESRRPSDTSRAAAASNHSNKTSTPKNRGAFGPITPRGGGPQIQSAHAPPLAPKARSSFSRTASSSIQFDVDDDEPSDSPRVSDGGGGRGGGGGEGPGSTSPGESPAQQFLRALQRAEDNDQLLHQNDDASCSNQASEVYEAGPSSPAPSTPPQLYNSHQVRPVVVAVPRRPVGSQVTPLSNITFPRPISVGGIQPSDRGVFTVSSTASPPAGRAHHQRESTSGSMGRREETMISVSELTSMSPLAVHLARHSAHPSMAEDSGSHLQPQSVTVEEEQSAPIHNHTLSYEEGLELQESCQAPTDAPPLPPPPPVAAKKGGGKADKPKKKKPKVARMLQALVKKIKGPFVKKKKAPPPTPPPPPATPKAAAATQTSKGNLATSDKAMNTKMVPDGSESRMAAAEPSVNRSCSSNDVKPLQRDASAGPSQRQTSEMVEEEEASHIADYVFPVVNETEEARQSAHTCSDEADYDGAHGNNCGVLNEVDLSDGRNAQYVGLSLPLKAAAEVSLTSPAKRGGSRGSSRSSGRPHTPTASQPPESIQRTPELPIVTYPKPTPKKKKTIRPTVTPQPVQSTLSPDMQAYAKRRRQLLKESRVRSSETHFQPYAEKKRISEVLNCDPSQNVRVNMSREEYVRLRHLNKREESILQELALVDNVIERRRRQSILKESLKEQQQQQQYAALRSEQHGGVSVEASSIQDQSNMAISTPRSGRKARPSIASYAERFMDVKQSTDVIASSVNSSAVIASASNQGKRRPQQAAACDDSGSSTNGISKDVVLYENLIALTVKDSAPRNSFKDIHVVHPYRDEAYVGEVRKALRQEYYQSATTMSASAPTEAGGSIRPSCTACSPRSANGLAHLGLRSLLQQIQASEGEGEGADTPLERVFREDLYEPSSRRRGSAAATRSASEQQALTPSPTSGSTEHSNGEHMRPFTPSQAALNAFVGHLHNQVVAEESSRRMRQQHDEKQQQQQRSPPHDEGRHSSTSTARNVELCRGTEYVSEEVSFSHYDSQHTSHMAQSTSPIHPLPYEKVLTSLPEPQPSRTSTRSADNAINVGEEEESMGRADSTVATSERSCQRDIEEDDANLSDPDGTDSFVFAEEEDEQPMDPPVVGSAISEHLSSTRDHDECDVVEVGTDSDSDSDAGPPVGSQPEVLVDGEPNEASSARSSNIDVASGEDEHHMENDDDHHDEDGADHHPTDSVVATPEKTQSSEGELPTSPHAGDALEKRSMDDEPIAELERMADSDGDSVDADDVRQSSSASASAARSSPKEGDDHQVLGADRSRSTAESCCYIAPLPPAHPQHAHVPLPPAVVPVNSESEDSSSSCCADIIDAVDLDVEEDASPVNGGDSTPSRRVHWAPGVDAASLHCTPLKVVSEGSGVSSPARPECHTPPAVYADDSPAVSDGQQRSHISTATPVRHMSTSPPPQPTTESCSAAAVLQRMNELDALLLQKFPNYFEVDKEAVSHPTPPRDGAGNTADSIVVRRRAEHPMKKAPQLPTVPLSVRIKEHREQHRYQPSNGYTEESDSRTGRLETTPSRREVQLDF